MKERMFSQDLLDRVWETLHDGICISDSEGIVLQVNNSHAKNSGMPREEMLGNSVRDFLKSGKLSIVLNPEVFATGKRVTCVQKTADGRKVILEANPIKDSAGNTVLCCTFSRDITTLSQLKQQIAEQRELLATFQALHQHQNEARQVPKIVYSTVMQKLYENIEAIAETASTTLILGETGVGKDVFARRIHELSPRSKKPFIKVDCGSIPESLIETELFGYVSGSFSGAHKNGKVGLIEAAEGGTLFLDEIGELPLQMQSRLLRVLQDREIMRVGATTPKKINVHILTATNKNLEHSIANGEFRRDLYYRLKVTVVRIPPLRKRSADILPMAQSFLEFYNAKYDKQLVFSDEVKKAFQAYHWPGNVRELENLIQGVTATCKNTMIYATDIPIIPEPRRTDEKIYKNIFGSVSFTGKTYKDIMKNAELQVLAELMKEFGSVAEIATRFHVDRSTIYRKVKELEKQKNL